MISDEVSWTSTWLVLTWCVEFFASEMASWLPQKRTVGIYFDISRSCRRYWSQISFAARAIAPLIWLWIAQPCSLLAKKWERRQWWICIQKSIFRLVICVKISLDRNGDLSVVYEAGGFGILRHIARLVSLLGNARSPGLSWIVRVVGWEMPD